MKNHLIPNKFWKSIFNYFIDIFVFFFVKEYRIVKDSFAGYEAQVKYPLWPFWMQMDYKNGINSFRTHEEALDFINSHRGRV